MRNLRQHTVYEFDNFRLDTATRLLFRDGEQTSVNPRAVETLIALIERKGEVVGKDELMQLIWTDTVVEESNLAQNLYVLRKTLGVRSDGKPYIETLKRRGYRFNGTVRVAKTGNGRVAPIEDAVEPDGPQGVQPKPANVISRPLEARNNVRAFSQVAVAREPVHSVDAERVDNVYAVADHRPSLVAAPSRPALPITRSKWFFPLVFLALVVESAGISFGIYKFAFAGERAGASVPFSGSDITRLTTTGRSKRVAISPDGKYFAHVMADPDGESIWLRQIAVANDTRIAGPFQSEVGWVTFEPSGNFVYFLTLARDKGEAELFRVPTLGGPIVKVANDTGAPTFSPDGTKFAFMQMNQEDSELIVANADGSNEVVITKRTTPDYIKIHWYAPAWSLDGKSLAFPVSQSDENGRYETVLAADVGTGVERKITDARWQRVGQSRWLEDGLVVAASETSTAPNQLWHVSLADGTASRITRDLNSYGDLSLTSDTNTLAVTQNHTVSNIWTVGEDPSSERQVRSEAGWLNELIWLPDGRLAYTSNAGGSSDIWTMNADGSGARQVTAGANARLGLALTADEKRFIFAAERNGKYNLWRADTDGSNLVQITNGDAELYPQCTPDGRWIVYQSSGSDPSIWKIPIDGGEPTLISKRGSRPSLSPDGKFVAYHYLDPNFERSRWGIGISNVETGERIKRFDFPPTVVERLVKWTRDGRGIAFHNSPGGVPNIWLQPLDGGDPKPLTTFSSDSIITFNWDADGSQLAVIRSVETSDVLLITRLSK